MTIHPFDRYAVFTNLTLLKEASARPLRKSLRVNTLKCSTELFERWAKYKKWKVEKIPWCDEGYFIDREDRETALGRDLFHSLGYIYLQEASSMLPVALLDPQPGEYVLDMSAAPGSKTTQIAARLQGRGVVVANDMNEKRLWTLASNLQRCGVKNVVITKKVGQWFSRHMTERFDKVLCDAPCTAQGTIRKDVSALLYSSEDAIEKMARLQYAILEAAINAAKVGGTIVYSTCTLTQEENERVITQILNKYSDQLEALENRALSKIMHQSISDSSVVRNTLTDAGDFPSYRLWPQTYDTEGFFCAVLKKIKPTRHVEPMEMRQRFEPMLSKKRDEKIRSEFADWYGTDFLNQDDILIETKQQIYATTKEANDFPLPMQDFLMGMPFCKETTHGFPRVSHEMVTLASNKAMQHVITLEGKSMKEFLSGKTIDSSVDMENGDCIVQGNIDGFILPLGRGLLKDGRLLNRLPRDMVAMYQ